MTILITAGPTREAIDPVRFLTNHSSGKMGYAIARQAARRNHRVILISGPTPIPIPDQVDFIPVESALEMFDAVKHHIASCQAACFVAAVSDYRPAVYSHSKLKKQDHPCALQLVPNPDILASARSVFGFQGTLMGFAAQTEDIEKNALKKLKQKECDFIVANEATKAFNSDDNEVLLLSPHHKLPLGPCSKDKIAQKLLETIENHVASLSF